VAEDDFRDGKVKTARFLKHAPGIVLIEGKFQNKTSYEQRTGTFPSQGRGISRLVMERAEIFSSTKVALQEGRITSAEVGAGKRRRNVKKSGGT